MSSKELFGDNNIEDYRIPIKGGEEFYIGIENEGEIFKEIIVGDIVTQYLISNQGRVYSRCSTCLMIPSIDNGYFNVALRVFVGKKAIWFRVHRIVIGCFYDGDIPYTIESVNHKNGNKSDNRIENLEYCTTTENNQHFARELKYEQEQTAQKIVSEMQLARINLSVTYNKQQKSPTCRYKKEISEKEIEEITQLVEQCYPSKMICIDYNIHISIIKTIKSKALMGKTTREVTDEEIHEICKEMIRINHEYTDKQLALKFGVRQSVISSIRRRQKRFEYIWSQYF